MVLVQLDDCFPFDTFKIQSVCQRRTQPNVQLTDAPNSRHLINGQKILCETNISIPVRCYCLIPRLPKDIQSNLQLTDAPNSGYI